MHSSPPATTPGEDSTPAQPRARLALLGGAILLASLWLFAATGHSGPPSGSIAAMLYALAGSLGAVVYVLSAVGLGLLVRPLYKGLHDEHTAQVGLGLSIQFTLSHLLGWSGLLSGSMGFLIALAPISLGLFLGARQAWLYLRDPSLRGTAADRISNATVGLSLASVPAIGILLVGACNPPGWLWSTEFGGYDALSYHLQLPQEWLGQGRLAPITHNVYSFLPSYFESAFMHIAVLSGAPTQSIGALLAYDGRPAVACQVLHALTAIAGAVLIARVTRSLLLKGGRDSAADRRARHAGGIAGGLFIATPWVIVVGSLAYNEMAMCALFVVALGIAADREAAPLRRWVMAAWLVGVACGIKPTALTFAGVPVAIMLLGTTPARAWLRTAPVAAGVGMLALCPWLVRNSLAGGNPVFPFLSSIFGSAHWTQDQLARYAAGHQPALGWADRLRLLALPDLGDPAGPRHRGMLHPQWAAFFPVVLACVGAILTQISRRKLGSLLSLGLLCQVLFWLGTTHLQSRFLLPLAVPGALLTGLAVESLLSVRFRIPFAVLGGVTAIPVVIQGAASTVIFLSQHGGRPNELLVAGPAVFSGALFRDELQSIPETDRSLFLQNMSAEAFCNFTLAPPNRLYLLGDATPFYFTCPVVYHTTWDTSPLGLAIRAAPDQPPSWSHALKARGITHVLYNAGEVDRLGRRSGWYDPDVTNETVTRWLDAEADPVHAWPQQNRYLFRLR